MADVPEPKEYKLWVPESFSQSGKVYMLSAAHRGDMYHIRGAMTLEPHPLIVYGSTEKTKDLTDYLRKGVPQAFITPLTWEELSGPNEPNDPNEPKDIKLHQRTFTRISESDATTVISDRVINQGDLDKLKIGMVCIGADVKGKLRGELEDLCKKLFVDEPSNSRTTILLMHRDTGTKGGIYPELDSGTESLTEIAGYIKAIPNVSGNTLDVKLCGNANPISNLTSIGEYFKLIESSKWTTETKRDIETFFLQVAFEMKYFHMAAGFRSGGLDVFTFLGIPTISISARQMVGEGRHSKLAIKNVFQRWNIQYELPRHGCTKFFSNRGLHLGSPWWKFEDKTDPTKKTPTDEDLKKQAIPPSGFRGYDKEIVRIGIYNAISVLLKRKITPFVPGVQNRQFCNESCRPCKFSDVIKKEEIHKYFDKNRKMEEDDFAERKSQMAERKESQTNFDGCEQKMKKQWAEILAKNTP